MTIVRWNPTSDVRPSMARVFDHFFGAYDGGYDYPFGYSSSVAAWEPDVDLYETADQLVVRAELPGMKRDDIELRIEAGTLTISGQREAETEASVDNYHRIERRYGRFTRSFRLPTVVSEDQVHATYEVGLLTIRLPKADSAKTRRIEIAA